MASIHGGRATSRAWTSDCGLPNPREQHLRRTAVRVPVLVLGARPGGRLAPVVQLPMVDGWMQMPCVYLSVGPGASWLPTHPADHCLSCYLLRGEVGIRRRALFRSHFYSKSLSPSPLPHSILPARAPLSSPYYRLARPSRAQFSPALSCPAALNLPGRVCVCRSRLPWL